jgi:AraC family transcriptional regulator
MPNRYQDIYPSPPLLNSADLARPSAAALLTLEYFEAPPGEMPMAVFAQHHIVLSYQLDHRVENIRDGVMHDYTLQKFDVVVTPAGVRSGWRWHSPSRCIIVTMDPKSLESFAQSEVGVLLSSAQLKSLQQFNDEDICNAGMMLLDALKNRSVGSKVMFESLARVFLIKLIQRYGDIRDDEAEFRSGFSAKQYKRVLDHIEINLERTIAVEELADVAGISLAHFSRLFKQTLGQSPHQFVLSFRVDKAKLQLADPIAPMIDVALGCGFADQAHFSRIFKQVAGVTPREYRTSLKAGT